MIRDTDAPQQNGDSEQLKTGYPSRHNTKMRSEEDSDAQSKREALRHGDLLGASWRIRKNGKRWDGNSDSWTKRQMGPTISTLNRALFYPELPWGAPPSWEETEWRGQAFLMYWELLSTAACFYVGFKVPYVTGVDEVKPLDHRKFHECSLKELGTGASGSLFAWLDLFCDILFVVDMYINLNTAKWVIDTQGREHWKLIDGLFEIRKLYIWGGFVPQFWTDILGVIPWC